LKKVSLFGLQREKEQKELFCCNDPNGVFYLRISLQAFLGILD
jgi:hypothetical protein